MRHAVSEATTHRLFRIAATIKGLDGLVEAVTGIVLLVVPAMRIKGLIETLANDEIQEGKHAFIAHYVLQLDQRIDVHVALFVAIYLLAHGLLKLALAVALLKQYFRLYPYAIAFLLAFIFYQTYLIGYNHSLLLAVLTLFDCAVAWLTYLEWRRHQVE